MNFLTCSNAFASISFRHSHQSGLRKLRLEEITDLPFDGKWDILVQCSVRFAVLQDHGLLAFERLAEMDPKHVIRGSSGKRGDLPAGERGVGKFLVRPSIEGVLSLHSGAGGCGTEPVDVTFR